MDASLLSSLLQSTVTMSVPLLLAALGEVLTERGGTINIGLEGLILTGAFAAMITAYFTGSAMAAVTAACAAGAALGALFAYAAVARGGNQIVLGIALNLLAFGLTGVAYRAIFGVTGTALTIEGLRTVPIPVLSSLPVVGPALFNQTILGYAAFVLVPVTAVFLFRTLPGVKVRMVGENLKAAAAQGIQVDLTRTLAIVAGAVLASLGGAYLALAYARTFVEGMSAGRGFIALAIVIFGRWSPLGVMSTALLFGLATALQFHIQALGLDIPYQFLLMLPYVLTLVVLAVHARHAAAPAALGQSPGAE